MTIKRSIPETDGVFFITFTCYKWLSLFSLTNSYDLVYKWFDILIAKSHQILGYVIMPNHLHVIIALKNSPQTVNAIVSNAKRFLAYGIIQRLKQENKKDILVELSKDLTITERRRKQHHKVFEPSFDVKICRSYGFVKQKLDYMHNNPCNKNWNLVNEPIEYKHSSMKFYSIFDTGIKSKITAYTKVFEENKE